MDTLTIDVIIEKQASLIAAHAGRVAKDLMLSTRVFLACDGRHIASSRCVPGMTSYAVPQIYINLTSAEIRDAGMDLSALRDLVEYHVRRQCPWWLIEAEAYYGREAK